MNKFFLLLGLPTFSGPQIVGALIVLFIVVALVGFVADAVLGDNGFGVAGNAVIVGISAVGGIVLWRHFGPSFGLKPIEISAVAGSVSTLLALIGCGILRRYI